ncbi:MAG: response regulator transcription factor [Pseudomonadota bacterium]
MTQRVRVMLADDHAVVRSGLRRMLEQQSRFEVVAEAESGEQAYHLYSEFMPDVLVMDLSMPGIGGLESLRRIMMRHAQARVIIFSMHENASFAFQALNLGALGYIAKSTLAEDLLTAVSSTARGETYISPVVSHKIALRSIYGEDELSNKLTAREFSIFKLLAEGTSIEDISRVLNISQKTVANYQAIIKQKLGVSSSIELLRLAIRYGLVDG